jgi:uncharacterized membrane protein
MASSESSPSRLRNVDAVRGAVMILMALDHVRDFFHRGAMQFSATDLSRTTPLLFLTRWVTHFCLPAFVFTTGLGTFLWLRRRNQTKKQLSGFLLRRGALFILLELTLLQFAYDFNLPTHYLILLLVLWIFGLCLVCLALLVRIPQRPLAVLSVLTIVLHDLFDGFAGPQKGMLSWVWHILHQPGLITVAGAQVLVTYTLIPWLPVVAAGFCFGEILVLPQPQRVKITRTLGWLLFGAFIVLRLINHYGDPLPWTTQRSAVMTVLSFLNCQKYPGSLAFLCMTLGPTLLALAYFDRHPPGPKNPAIVFGRAPLFYFVLHLYVIHVFLVLASWLRYGAAANSFIFNPTPSMGGPAQLFPANFGWSLTTVYLLWIVLLALLYPLCRWFARVKSERPTSFLAYF